MKKLLIGCGAIGLLVFCLVVGVAIWGANKFKAYQQGLVKVKTAYEATNRSYPFTPPDPPVMRAERFQKYLAVRAALAKALEGEKNSMKRAADSGNPRPDFSFADFLHLTGLPQRVGTAHVKALEEQSMSVDEYLWHSRIVLGTILKAIKEGKNIADELSKAYGDAAQRNAAPASNGDPSAPAPSMDAVLQVDDVPLLEENLKLVNGARDHLSTNPELMSVDMILRQIQSGSASQPPPVPSGSGRTGSTDGQP